jgi:valyl-tRNA synthetase
VKVTPAHDPNDYQCYTRHPEIGIINILNPDGTINENGGKYQGLDRYKAREAVVKDMEEMGLFEGKEDRVIPMKFSDRSKTPIEPYLSDQWFVKMGDRDDGKPGFAQMAMDAVTSGRVKFFPERYARTYLEWLGEKRDWCISRQLWWGHRIPVWYWKGPNNTGDMDEHATRELHKLYRKNKDRLALGSTAVDGQPWSEEEEDDEGRAASLFICLGPDADDLARELESIGFVQDPDVLDTWFSSQLWTHSTFGWPDKTPELEYWYPTSALVTSRDIITLWVARMVIAGLYNLGEVPFREVYITPKMLDGFGETMSKSKGNGVDPLDIIELYGTDALRFQMVSIAGETQDSRLPVANVCPYCEELIPVKQEHMYLRTKKLTCPKCKKPFRPGGPWPDEDAELPTAKQASERFEIGRNFANKLWNAARFVLKELQGYKHAPLDPKTLPIEDRWILSRLATTAKAVTEQLEAYHFNEVSRTIYDFTWSEFCDWYIEMAKGRLKEGEPAASKGGGKSAVQWVLVNVLDSILRLVHPVMPFVAESLWQELNKIVPTRALPTANKATETIAFAPWPVLPVEWQDPAMETRIARMQELVRIVRDVRNRYNVDGKTPLDVFVRCSDAVAADFRALQTFITLLAGVGKLECGPAVVKPKQAASQVTPEFEAYVSLVGLIDPAAEVKRLEKQVTDKTKQLEGTKKKLANADFVAKAPPEVVASQRELIADLETQIASMQDTIRELKAG